MQVEKKTLPPVYPVHEYHCVLSQNEVDALVSILGYVGGLPDTTPRKHIDTIFRALKEHVKVLEEKIKGSIYFQTLEEYNSKYVKPV